MILLISYIYILYLYYSNNIKRWLDANDMNKLIEKELYKEMTVHLPSTDSGIPRYLQY